MSWNFGVHKEFDIKGHKIECGLDYLTFEQKMTYNYSYSTFYPARAHKFQQLRIPLTYNWHLLKNKENLPKLIFKAGLSAGFTLRETAKETSIDGVTPADYKFTNFDAGINLGAAFFPIVIKSRVRLGMFLDIYQGSVIYTDVYTKDQGGGENNYMKFGVAVNPLR